MADLDAKHYRKNSSTQYALAHEILDAIDFKGSEVILDIGCGDGRITTELAKCVPRGKVIGIDPSSSMIDLAIQSFSKKGYPHLDFKKISAEGLQLKQCVDIALMMNTLHWIRDPWTALRNVAAALKPGGTLFILTYPKESPYWNFLEKTLKNKKWLTFVDQSASKTILTTQEYQKILEDSGLIIEDYSLEEKVVAYSSSEDLMAYIKGWLNCYLPIPKELENAFLQIAVKNALAFSLHQSGNEIVLPFLKLTLKARKKEQSRKNCLSLFVKDVMLLT